MTDRGTLILVVGPSGAGKDSIITGAAERCRDRRIVFARRLITRPAVAGGEGHIPVSPSEFAEWRDAGRLMLYWNAHGFDYGLPQELAAALEQGSTVIANVSRTVLPEARRRFPPVAVVSVAASPATLAARLAIRGRETASDMAHRLERASALAAAEPNFTIDNDGALDVAVARFVEVLREVLERPARLAADLQTASESRPLRRGGGWPPDGVGNRRDPGSFSPAPWPPSSQRRRQTASRAWGRLIKPAASSGENGPPCATPAARAAIR